MKYTMIPECVIITIYFNSNGNLNFKKHTNNIIFKYQNNPDIFFIYQNKNLN